MSVAFCGVPIEDMPMPGRAFVGALFFAHNAKDRMIGDSNKLRVRAAFGAGARGSGRRVSNTQCFQRGQALFQIGHTSGQGPQVFPDRNLIEDFQNV